ncbi:hypothetical protein XNC3_2420069 [Xenorhabdus nematophila F1]|nr:hypothetical protein XNC3_2420069 [Xenorhabdus nematophila F1]
MSDLNVRVQMPTDSVWNVVGGWFWEVKIAFFMFCKTFIKSM